MFRSKEPERERSSKENENQELKPTRRDARTPGDDDLHTLCPSPFFPPLSLRNEESCAAWSVDLQPQQVRNRSAPPFFLSLSMSSPTLQPKPASPNRDRIAPLDLHHLRPHHSINREGGRRDSFWSRRPSTAERARKLKVRLEATRRWFGCSDPLSDFLRPLPRVKMFL